MTTIMSVAFMLMNGFQQSYQREEAYADAARNAHHRRDGCTQFEDVNFLPEQEARVEIMNADRRACERFDQMALHSCDCVELLTCSGAAVERLARKQPRLWSLIRGASAS